MINITIKKHGRKFNIPIPYSLLKFSLRIVTSKIVRSIANQSIKKSGNTSFQIPKMDRNAVKSLLKELAQQKGLSLLETNLKDGTEISIKL